MTGPICEQACKELGIQFVDTDEDILVIHSRGVDHRSLKDYSKPIIVIRTSDYSYVETCERNLITLPNTKAVFCFHVLDPIERNNDKTYSRAIFSDRIIKAAPHLFSDDEKELISPKILFTEYDFSKFMLNAAIYPNITINVTPPLSVKKTIDVFFAGRTFYPKLVYGNVHRQMMLDKLEAIIDNNKIKTEVQLYASTDKVLSSGVYMQKMYSSKICLSPWGYGAWCWRDIEAMAAGALVIKPKTDFIRFYPNVYTKDFMVFCKEDFSDLPDIIDDAMSNWNNYTHIRNNAYEMMKFFYQQDIHLKRFLMDIRKVYNNANNTH